MSGAGFVVDTREKLIDALTEAAELEHGLLIQYLFAAYSLKKSPAEGITEAEAERAREWEAQLLYVARDEMAHLGTVCNLLQAIGSAPRFGRPNFPQPPNRYYPFEFKLERFGEESLQRFVMFERPVDKSAQPSTTMEYEHIGELYRKIKDGFQMLEGEYRMRRQSLFIGPVEAQDRDDWTASLSINEVSNLRTALEAIDSIILAGEGSPTGGKGSHYELFSGILEELRKVKKSRAFEPARPVVITPLSRVHPDSAEGYSLLEPGTAAHGVSQLFSRVYNSMLLMLMQYYDYGGETPTQRQGLQANIRRTMSAIIRPLAEVLTQLPAGNAYPGQTAGPGFEIYTDLRLPRHLPSRWTTLVERVAADGRTCLQLAGTHGALLQRLHFIAGNFDLLRANIEQLAMEGR